MYSRFFFTLLSKLSINSLHHSFAIKLVVVWVILLKQGGQSGLRQLFLDIDTCPNLLGQLQIWLNWPRNMVKFLIKVNKIESQTLWVTLYTNQTSQIG